MHRPNAIGWIWIALGLLLMATGCATDLDRAGESFYRGQPEESLAILSQFSDLGRKNQLLRLMEQGVVFHQLGEYERSADALLDAAALMEELNKISVTEQTGSLVLNEWITKYKGEYSERLWVHTYLMMDFLLLNRPESALVEAKRALKVFDAFPEALARDHFSRALIALCFENLFEYNDAFIEYRKLAEQLSSRSVAAWELSRIASLLGMPDEARAYREEVPEAFRHLAKDADESELILFISLGRGPIKHSGDIIVPPGTRFSFPVYQEHDYVDTEIAILEDERRLVNTVITTHVYDVSHDALEARKGYIFGKELARVSTKEILVHELEEDRDTWYLGILARMGFITMEEADTRCWQTLPAAFKLVKVPVCAGAHRFRVMFNPTEHGGGTEVILPEVHVRRGGRAFFSIRLL
jgi:tetratricopeptide (TPR) repeat protein